jgi:glutamine amidotransferase
MKIAIIDYGSGNLHSAKKAFEKAASNLNSNYKIQITNNAEDIKSATHIVLPGVGAFGDCKRGLDATKLIPTLEEEVFGKKKPFLGICVGMQLLAEKGLENGEFTGLGWISGKVDKIENTNNSLRIPHMGWNNLEIKKPHAIFSDIKENSDIYFVHSYRFFCDEKFILATTDYGQKIPAVIAKDNILGFQFHPEKSQNIGIKLIENFIRQ